MSINTQLEDVSKCTTDLLKAELLLQRIHMQPHCLTCLDRNSYSGTLIHHRTIVAAGMKSLVN